MSQYSHLTVDFANENSAPTKIARLVGCDRWVLDVGCAHGYLAEALRAQGCRVVGIERDVEDASRARQHCEEVVVSDVDEPGWVDELGGRRFDVIVFGDVLEHLRDPARVLRQACGLLVPETGFMVASIPNVAHVSVRLELLLGSFRRETLGILDATHLHFFTRDAVHELFASCEMAIESWECTTNEVADHVIADYLSRAGLSYTPALREQFAAFDAMAYQFIITARPAKGPITSVVPAVEKPLQTMQETIRAFHETRQAYEEMSRTLDAKNRAYEEASRALDERNRAYEAVSRTLDEKNRAYEEASQALDERNRAYEAVSQALDERNRAYEAVSRALDERNRAYEDASRALDERNRAYEDMSRALDERNRAYEDVSRALDERTRAYEDVSRALNEKDRALEERSRAYEESSRALARLRTTPAEVEQPRDGGLRVLQVVHQFLPHHPGGTEIYCSDLSFALARRGNAVRVLSAAPLAGDVGTSVQWEDGQAIVVEKVAAMRQYRRLETVGSFFDRFDNPEARQAIRWILHRMRPDVVHVQHLLYLSAELFAECRKFGIPVVVTLHDYWFLCHRIKLRRRDGSLCEGPARGWNCCQCLNTPALVRSHLNPLAVGANMYRYAYLTRQLMKADRILAPSRFLRDMYSRNGVPAERITHCDFGTMTPPPEVVARFGAPRSRGRIRFGFLGSLIYDKGVHVLIDAFNQLPAGAAELHVFGIPGEPAYVEDLQRRVRHPDTHWRGSVPHVDRWQALTEIDVLVVPSVWYENSPLTIHEAHRARVPVIASAIGGIPELVHDGVTGRTFPFGNANALAALLREVVAQPERLSEWQRAIVPPKTMAAHAEEIEAIYRELRRTS